MPVGVWIGNALRDELASRDREVIGHRRRRAAEDAGRMGREVAPATS
jgi:hypothetical protein